MIDLENTVLVDLDDLSVLLQVFVKVVFAVLNQEFVALLLLQASHLIEETTLRQIHRLLYLLVTQTFVWLSQEWFIRLLVWRVIRLVRALILLLFLLLLLLHLLDLFALLRFLCRASVLTDATLSFVHVLLLWLEVRAVENSNLTLLDINLLAKVAIGVLFFRI